MLSAKQGSLASFNVLVERHQRAVFKLSCRWFGSTQEAEDATQDTFLKAWQAASSFHGGVVRPWFMRIATNRCYDRLRSLARHPTDSLTDDENNAESPIPDPDELLNPQAQVERQELANVLQAALDALPSDQRIAVILCDVQRYSYEEAAQITGVPVGTVKSRAFRGRERLRNYLQAQPETGELLSGFGRFSDE